MDNTDLISKINKDYNEYMITGKIKTFNKDSVLKNDIFEIKNTLIDKLDDSFVVEKLEHLYKNKSKNIINELVKLFKRAYDDNDIQGYYDNYISHQEIEDVIDIYFELFC